MLMDIGLEVHVELATASKLFCSCPTAFGAPPNTACCPVCLGLPGTLPLLNRQAVELAVRAGLALDCTVAEETAFDRKNYFYPDLPRGYQITQFYRPICVNGSLTVETGNGRRQIGIRELHLEDDAGKLVYADGETAVDYNRCGVPLIEIVTMPDMHSGEEAVAFLEELMGVLTYAGISDCKMQEGSLRADVNLSVRPDEHAPLGERTEMKNLSSLRAVARAIAWEGQRQTSVLACGGSICRETRRWDEDREESLPLREKESAADYRYFPEPDIPSLRIGSAVAETQRRQIPELPASRRLRYVKDWGLNDQSARTLTARLETAEYFEAAVAAGCRPLEAAKWIQTDLLRIWKARPVGRMSPQRLAELDEMVQKGCLNRATAREMLEPLHESREGPRDYAQKHGLGQISDSQIVEQAVLEVLESCPEQVAQYHSGKKKVRTFLQGQVMRKLSGKGDPLVISLVLGRFLDENS